MRHPRQNKLKPRSNPPGGSRPVRALAIEVLEDRRLLAFTVNHTPYLQLGDAALDGYNAGTDQAEVIWQTTGTQDTDSFTAEYRETGQVSWNGVSLNAQIVTGVGGRINHSATFVALNFDDDYDYRIIHLRNGSPIATYQSTFHTRLDVGDAGAFTFATYGDSASGNPPSDFIAVQNQINLLDPAFSLLLGDNVYTDGTHPEFDLRLDPSINPSLTTYNKDHIDYFGFGNHDVGYNSGQAARENYSMPIPVEGVTSPVGLVFDSNVQEEENYSFDYGSVHFVTFDTNNWTNTAALDKQLDWAVADIQAARARTNPAQWVIVFGHHPITSLAGHTEHTPDDHYYDQMMSRLGTTGVGADLLLFGHTHNYQRSYPLTGHVGSTATYVLDTDNDYAKGAGLPMVIQGTGGVDVGYGAGDATFAGTYLAKALDSNTSIPAEFGFGRVDVAANQLTYRYINVLGQTLDTFTITDGGDATGPRATMADPQDNGAPDTDPDDNQLSLSTSPTDFQIRLWDIGEGVDDATVLSSAVSVTRDAVALVAGSHYTFAYDAATNVITLTPLGSSFGNGTYNISLASTIEDLADNDLALTTISVVVNAQSATTVSFRNGENGYTAAKDTYLHEDDPATNQGGNLKIVSDGDDDLGTSETPPQRVQGLIRFDAMFNTPFGSRGGGPIPDGSDVLSAMLSVRTGATSGDSSASGNFFLLHRMIATWSESTTWSSMSAGVSTDDVEAALVGTTLVNGPSTLGGWVSFDVTSDMQIWSDNNSLSTRGWVVNPTIGTDGWRIDSNNTSTVANRPILTVTYASGPTNLLAGAPYSIAEGGSLALSGSASGTGLTYSWDLNGDSVFGDAIGATPTLTWTQLVALGIDDGPTTRVISMRVTDVSTTSRTDTTWLTITNVAPTASIGAAASAVRGEPVSFILTAADPSPVDQAAGFSFDIDWDGNGSIDQTVLGSSGTIVEHIFPVSNIYEVKITATDVDGATSSLAQHSISVANWEQRANLGNPTLTDLIWGGTHSVDQWIFVGDGSTVSVGDFLASSSTVVTDVTGDVVVYGQADNDLVLLLGLDGSTVDLGAGNDAAAIVSATGGSYLIMGGVGSDGLYVLDAVGAQVTLSGGDDADELYVVNGDSLGVTMLGGDDADMLILLGGSLSTLDMQGEAGDDVALLLDGAFGSAVVDGGDDNDILLNATGMPVILRGQQGDDLLVGGADSDSIEGGVGNDVLVGSDGGDSLSGGAGEDLILAGLLDDIYFGEEVTPGVVQVWEQWKSSDSIATRKNYLTGAPGGIIDLEFVIVAGDTVLDDGVVDVVLGESDADWLLYDFGQDITDYSVGVDLRTDLG